MERQCKNKDKTEQVIIIMDDGCPKLKQSAQQDLASTPMIQQPARGPTLRRLNFSKPKSRFAENNYHFPQKLIPESQELQPLNAKDSNPSTDDDGDEDDDEWCESEEEEDGEKHKSKRRRKINRRALMEWALFLSIMTCLICSLTLDSVKNGVKWGLKIWKWCLMVMLVFCGRLVSGWVVSLLVFLIERNFMLREKVVYFVYGLRKSFQNCVWLGLVLLAWTIMFPNVRKHNRVLRKVFRALIAVLIAATIWLLKIILVKVLASSFHVATFFDRMKESVFHHYCLDALSGPPLDDALREPPRRRTLGASKPLPALWKEPMRMEPRRIDMEKLRRLSTEGSASAWSVKRLVSYVMSSGLSTISRTVDDSGQTEEITSELEARNCAQRIFKNVAKPAAK